MKIAVNTRFLLPGRLEGIGRYTLEVVQRLAACRPEDEFIFFFDRPWDPAFISSPNITPVAVFPPARHPLLWYAWFELALPKQLEKYKPDVFISPDGYCSLGAGTPTLMVIHDIAHVHYPGQIPFLVRSYYDFFIPRYLRRAEKIVTVSNFSKADIVQHYGIQPGRISVAPNGANSQFKPLSAASQQQVRLQYANGHPYFFYLGAIHPRKNLERLIAAFDVFKTRTGAPHQLLLGGRLAWQTGGLKEALEKTSYRHDIKLLGYVPDEILPPLVAAAFALTYVSLFEGFGVPLLEAMHAETALITANCSAMPEVAGDAALLVDPYQTASIATAMEKLVIMPGLREELIQRGRLQRQRYDWDLTTAIISQEIDKLFTSRSVMK
jgi:glycosyltransferase involved in cell wall biosynthesis